MALENMTDNFPQILSLCSESPMNSVAVLLRPRWLVHSLWTCRTKR